ncbi:MAG: hypothetical protein M1835_006481 [Candelina submexicana]|nr:MAG: hypothetical protein M1835_006481 [Candelina submexicana]
MEASQLVGAIRDEVDPEKKTHVNLKIALTAVSIGLGFIPVSRYSNSAEPCAIAIAAANLRLGAIKKASSVAANKWPQGTEDSRLEQIDILEASIPFLQSSFSTNLGLGLASVQGLPQSNVSQFLAFANGGIFSAPDMDLPQVSTPFRNHSYHEYLLRLGPPLIGTAWQICKISIGDDPMAYSNHTLDGCPAWKTECSPKKVDLECDRYEVTGQCNGTYWWYSKLKKPPIFRPTTMSGWTTGKLLFENAAICNIQNMLNQSIPNLIYTTSHGIAGFAFQGDVPSELSGLTSKSNSTANFIPMNGAGLSHLSTIPAYAAQLFHPTDNLWNLDASGVDFSCTSQLNVSIANSWGHPWTKKSPSS